MARFDLALLPERPDLSFESALWESGLPCVAGIDEAGRGALAGPVSAAAVVFPPEPALYEKLASVRDSKQMTPQEREAARPLIEAAALAWGVGFASAQEIDALGIVPATRLAVVRALQALPVIPQHLLLDYLTLPEVETPQTALVKGDCRALSIAAASILAKTSRDALLRQMEVEYPGYGFARHKGYGTLAHREALERLGACAVHRKSFRPVRELVERKF